MTAILKVGDRVHLRGGNPTFLGTVASLNYGHPQWPVHVLWDAGHNSVFDLNEVVVVAPADDVAAIRAILQEHLQPTIHNHLRSVQNGSTQALEDALVRYCEAVRRSTNKDE